MILIQETPGKNFRAGLKTVDLKAAFLSVKKEQIQTLSLMQHGVNATVTPLLFAAE